MKNYIIQCFTCWSDECLISLGIKGMFLQALVLGIISSILIIDLVFLYSYLKYKN